MDDPNRLYESIISLDLNDRDIAIINSGLEALSEQAKMAKAMSKNNDLMKKMNTFCHEISSLKQRLSSIV